MEPGDRPYAGPDSAPGDVGTGEPADHPATPDAKGLAPLAPPDGGAIDDGILDDSPADEIGAGLAGLGEPAGSAD